MIRPRLNALVRQGSGPGFKRRAKITENIRMRAEAGVDVYLVYEIIKRVNEAEGFDGNSDTAIRRHAGSLLQKTASFFFAGQYADAPQDLHSTSFSIPKQPSARGRN